MIKKVLSLLGLSVLLGGAAHASSVMSEADFTKSYVLYLAGHRSDLELVVEQPLQIKAKSPEHDFGTLYLHNVYTLYRQDPSRQEELFSKYSASILDHSQEPSASLDTLVVVVKGKDWVDDMNRMTMGSDGKGFTILSEPIAGDLFLVYATDTPNSVTYQDRKKILALDASAEKIKEVGLQNLRKAIGSYHFEEYERDVFQAQSDTGDYDSSIPLLPEAFHDFIARTQAQSVVFSSPARNVLLVADAKNIDALNHMRSLTGQVYKTDPYAVSPLLYTLSNGRWGVYDEKQ